MTYKKHLIFVAAQRDAGGCFWLPIASISWSEGERRVVIPLKGHPQDRFIHLIEAEKHAISMARKWVDSHSQNGSSG
jgi:hypothetical protein